MYHVCERMNSKLKKLCYDDVMIKVYAMTYASFMNEETAEEFQEVMMQMYVLLCFPYEEKMPKYDLT